MAAQPTHAVGYNAEDMEMRQQEVELTEFTKYVKLAPELRRHTLTFNNLKTMKEYAKCSKLCQSEFRALRLPYRIELEEANDEVVVTIGFKKIEEVEKRKFKFLDKDRAMEEICQYIENRTKKYGVIPTELKINMKKWPTIIVNMPKMALIEKWHVTINRFMYDSFMEFARTKEWDRSVLATLYLKDCENVEDRMVIGPELFGTSFILDLGKLEISAKFEMRQEDFLNMDHVDLNVTNWTLYYEAIRKKVEKAPPPLELLIELAPENDLMFDMAELFPIDRFDVRKIENNPHGLMKIRAYSSDCSRGRVVGNIFQEGKVLYLKFLTSCEGSFLYNTSLVTATDDEKHLENDNKEDEQPN